MRIMDGPRSSPYNLAQLTLSTFSLVKAKPYVEETTAVEREQTSPRLMEAEILPDISITLFPR